MPHVSQSKLKTWRGCHKAYDYKYNQNLTKKAPAKPLIRGTIWGEMLDARAIKGGRVKPLDVLEKYRRKYRVLFKEEREMYGDLIGDLRRIYEAYERTYADDPWAIEGVESLVTVDLVRDIRFIGYIDKRVKDAQKRKWIVDHKMMRTLPDEEERFSDLQLVLYAWAWNLSNPNDQIDGVCWDYALGSPPTIPKINKDGTVSIREIKTDYDTFMKVLTENKIDPAKYKSRLKELKNQASPFFRRVYLPLHNETLVNTILEDSKQTAIEIENLGKLLKDRNLSFRCKLCDFYKLCQAELHGLDADYIRETDYTIRENDEEPINEEEQ